MKFGLPVDAIEFIRIFFFFLKFFIGNAIMQSIYKHIFLNKTSEMQAKKQKYAGILG